MKIGTCEQCDTGQGTGHHLDDDIQTGTCEQCDTGQGTLEKGTRHHLDDYIQMGTCEQLDTWQQSLVSDGFNWPINVFCITIWTRLVHRFKHRQKRPKMTAGGSKKIFSVSPPKIAPRVQKLQKPTFCPIFRSGSRSRAIPGSDTPGSDTLGT